MIDSYPTKLDHYDYGLLLGCPCLDDGSLSSSQISRCKLAISAYQKGRYSTLIISGGAVQNEYTESIAMKKYVVSINPSIPIKLETNSKNTYQNFVNVYDMIDDASVLVLSSDLHLKRALAFAHKFFTTYDGMGYKDRKIKNIFLEIRSRIIFVIYEFKHRKK